MPVTQPLISNSVPAGALPSLWKQAGVEVDIRAVGEALHFNKKEIANAARVPQGSFSYQGHIPPELQKRLKEWVAVLEVAAAFFGNDLDATTKWFLTPNPRLGGAEPRDMIRFGRANKLVRMIQDEAVGNVP